MLLGTSQNDNFSVFFPYSAARTKYIRLNLNTRLRGGDMYKIMKYYKKEILEFKPDILIFSIWGKNSKSMLQSCENIFKK